MRSWKRMAAIVLFAAMLLCMAACGDQQGETVAETTGAAANASYSGTILAISYDSITLSTENGEVTVALTDATTYSYDSEEMGFGAMGGMMGKPDGEMQKPDGDMEPPEGMNGEKPEGTGGEMPDDAFFYDIPEGLPETDPEGIHDIPDPGEGDTMPGMSVEALTLGSTVTVQTDASGNASSVTLTSSSVLDSFGGMGGFGGENANGFDRLDGSSD